MLVLNEDIKNQIIKHAIHELPNEACGLFLQTSVQVLLPVLPDGKCCKIRDNLSIGSIGNDESEGIADAERGKSLE